MNAGNWQELAGSGLQPILCVACAHLGPVVFFPAAPWGSAEGAGHRVEPEALGLRWKEGVRMMKSCRTYLTPHPSGEEGGLPGNPRLDEGARSLRLFLPLSPNYPFLLS